MKIKTLFDVDDAFPEALALYQGKDPSEFRDLGGEVRMGEWLRMYHHSHYQLVMQQYAEHLQCIDCADAKAAGEVVES